jgi:glutaredoxin 3
MKNKTYQDAAILIAVLLIGLFLGEGINRLSQWYSMPAPYFETNTEKHYVNSEEKVVMYTTQWCPYCKKAREFLTLNNITFDERDIENGSEETKSLYRSLEKEGIPQIIIGNKIFSGFNRAALEQELNLTD